TFDGMLLHYSIADTVVGRQQRTGAEAGMEFSIQELAATLERHPTAVRRALNELDGLLLEYRPATSRVEGVGEARAAGRGARRDGPRPTDPSATARLRILEAQPGDCGSRSARA